MLDTTDDYCKVITGDVAVNKSVLNALQSVGIEKKDAERLMNETGLEVRKFRSNKPLMEDCAVVKCSQWIFWNIPHKLLERSVKNA